MALGSFRDRQRDVLRRDLKDVDEVLNLRGKLTHFVEQSTGALNRHSDQIDEHDSHIRNLQRAINNLQETVAYQERLIVLLAGGQYGVAMLEATQHYLDTCGVQREEEPGG